jgi:hypothetical protein
MFDSSYQRADFPQPRGPVARRIGDWPSEPSLGEALLRIVRRIVRNRTARTDFQARVLETAQRVRDSGGRELEREAFERMIVDRLLCACRDMRCVPMAQETDPACPTTWGAIFEMTFAGQAASR